MAQRYTTFFTDFAFKRLFGTEENKDLLKDFLNEVLEGEQVISDLTLRQTEHLGSAAADRRAVFDIYCQNADGERFIIELQKAKQQFFKDRSVFYSTFPIQEQAQKGNWDFELQAVYTIGLLDFCFDDTDDAMLELPSPRPYLHRVKLIEQSTCEVFYDKLTFIYLEMPRFHLTEEEVREAGHFEKWIYLLKNLGTLDRIPDWAKEQVFLKFMEQAEIAEFAPNEQESYQASLKHYRDLTNVIETAREEGREEGRAEGQEEGRENLSQELRKKWQDQGFSDDEIDKLLD